MAVICDANGTAGLPVAVRSGTGAGGPRAVVEALLAAAHAGVPAVLGLVVDTNGSTYAKPGALLCVAEGARVGWISGGCLESSLEASARAQLAARQAGVVEYDTRDDADLLVGSGIGCRGVVRIALVPLTLVAGIAAPLEAWTRQARDLDVALLATGELIVRAGEVGGRWMPPWEPAAVAALDGDRHLRIARAPRLLVFGAGPESATLLPWLRQLGWYVDVAERRPRWDAAAAHADRHLQVPPGTVLADAQHDAALVMNHDFELDREALEHLAAAPIPWIGLLGPPARRDDLLRLLGPAAAAALQPRLHAPVGLDLGGRGPEAIALAITAQLHAWRHGGG
ncbi:XdhC family protein [Dokdonella koreensis]|uniref:Xanthine and CO dehydrogenase maturation factor, XdhC/CoxF family n=1 Tax=Dokdonella koreensis DS-123 TaxID=1300342 RepID=A0A167H5K3_9GAMM|nr:XdhC/CoxI family protein [Dokdonella koreensis]ANB19026.1 Xanthine and CO dehydrogenase maturation factor, XdhC/CoxF family [Dokdonella koreensis DS-123]